MKRRNFIRDLEDSGCVLHRHGSRHDINRNPSNDKKAPVPRHNELRESLCRLVRKQLGLTT